MLFSGWGRRQASPFNILWFGDSPRLAGVPTPVPDREHYPLVCLLGAKLDLGFHEPMREILLASHSLTRKTLSPMLPT